MTTDAPAKPAIFSRQLGSYEAEAYLSLPSFLDGFHDEPWLDSLRTGYHHSKLNPGNYVVGVQPRGSTRGKQ